MTADPIPTVLVAQPQSYIDSLWVFRWYAFDVLHLRALRALCGSLRVDTVDTGERTGFTLTVHQPRREALVLIATEVSATASQVHIALDLPTATPGDGQRLIEWLGRHLLPQKRVSESVTWWHDENGDPDFPTLYWNFRAGKKAGKHAVAYADKPSKVIASQPCAHLEYRLRGKTVLARGDAYMVKNLIDFDHCAFWNEQLYLVDRLPERLAGAHKWLGWCTQSLLDGRRKYEPQPAYGDDEIQCVRLGSFATRGSADTQSHESNANNLLLDFQRYAHTSRGALALFPRLDHRWMLPQPV